MEPDWEGRGMDYLETRDVASLLKSELGLNSRQASVKKQSSDQYLKITIRDASVNPRLVRNFAKRYSTWKMDNTDLCTGQSIDVALSKEVCEKKSSNYTKYTELVREAIRSVNGLKDEYRSVDIDGKKVIFSCVNGIKNHIQAHFDGNRAYVHVDDMDKDSFIKSISTQLMYIVEFGY